MPVTCPKIIIYIMLMYYSSLLKQTIFKNLDKTKSIYHHVKSSTFTTTRAAINIIIVVSISCVCVMCFSLRATNPKVTKNVDKMIIVIILSFHAISTCAYVCSCDTTCVACLNWVEDKIHRKYILLCSIKRNVIWGFMLNTSELKFFLFLSVTFEAVEFQLSCLARNTIFDLPCVLVVRRWYNRKMYT